jgi:hypothetical protein
MTKSALAAAATALVLCGFPGSVASADTLPSRVAASLGQVIAAQGNAALMQIRNDLKKSALKTIEPFLPKPDDSAESADTPAATPVARR